MFFPGIFDMGMVSRAFEAEFMKESSNSQEAFNKRKMSSLIPKAKSNRHEIHKRNR